MRQHERAVPFARTVRPTQVPVTSLRTASRAPPGVAPPGVATHSRPRSQGNCAKPRAQKATSIISTISSISVALTGGSCLDAPSHRTVARLCQEAPHDSPEGMSLWRHPGSEPSAGRRTRRGVFNVSNPVYLLKTDRQLETMNPTGSWFLFFFLASLLVPSDELSLMDGSLFLSASPQAPRLGRPDPLQSARR